MRRGKVGYGGSGSFHEDGSRLMDLLQSDPARHALHHLDTYAGYLLLQVTTIDGSTSGGVRLLGKVPYDVQTALSKHYGRINKISDSETRVKMSPVEVCLALPLALKMRGI